MKKLTLFAFAAAMGLIAGCMQEKTDMLEIPIYSVSASGIGQPIGKATAFDSAEGLSLSVRATGFTPGVHGFHVHENPSCAPAMGADGKPAAALAAGGHFDPDHTTKHLGPDAQGHKGDLPPLLADGAGQINMTVTAPRLKTSDLKNRSLMIHAGADNYSDAPLPLGGGGARVACGVIE